MPDNTHFYQPKDGHQLEHDPFNSIIAPRPIGWISSKSPNGQVNLAPYSFFNAFNYHPPIIGFSSIGYKDSVKNAADSGEFCWNLVTRSLADMMNQTSVAVGSDVDEFELANIAKGQSKVIDVPHVALSPVVMECKTSQVIQLQSSFGENCQSWLVLGEVVGVHISQMALKDGVYDTAAMQPVMRGGGPGDYFSVSELQKFQLFRPKQG
ncbi:flavin reductase family protein [uncultured Paraglaciecola sp.]|mgnify:FL=1|uniref:flavin reductase family protein n=1 Tax=uncultured Paraglaciecola sp. TaxID=1765024 RepID=UPI002618D515|nr:flavin reductase family protein [uncultured Paraglaciecola sp.]